MIDTTNVKPRPTREAAYQATYRERLAARNQKLVLQAKAADEVLHWLQMGGAESLGLETADFFGDKERGLANLLDGLKTVACDLKRLKSPGKTINVKPLHQKPKVTRKTTAKK